MTGWETILAACGGLVLGFGLGMVLTRGRELDGAKRLRRIESRVRGSVIPVLEARAMELGLTKEQRDSHETDPLELAVSLSTSIQQFEDNNNVAFSDTLEVSRAELKEPRS
ncbi:MAG: hypothetical protein AAGF12_34730 [Myxococcota bacterium]